MLRRTRASGRLRYELGLTESTIAKLQGRIDELRKSPTLGFTTFIDTAQISDPQKKIDELSRVRDQTQARIAFLEGPPEQPCALGQALPSPDNTAGVKDTGPSGCSASRRAWRARCSASRTRAASGSSPSMSAGSRRSRRSGPRTAATRPCVRPALGLRVKKAEAVEGRTLHLNLIADNGCQPTSLAFMRACAAMGIRQAFTSYSNADRDLAHRGAPLRGSSSARRGRPAAG